VHFDEEGFDMIAIDGLYDREKIRKIANAEMDFLERK